MTRPPGDNNVEKRPQAMADGQPDRVLPGTAGDPAPLRKWGAADLAVLLELR